MIGKVEGFIFYLVFFEEAKLIALVTSKAGTSPMDSAMAEHCIESKHEMGAIDVIKDVRDPRQLDAWESLFIIRGEKLVNIDSPLISFSPQFESKSLRMES